MAESTHPTFASPQIAHDFARAMKESPTTKEIRLIGRKDVRSFLAALDKAGKTSRRAKVIFR